MHGQVCGSEVHQGEEKSEPGDVDLANFLCSVYEIAKLEHSCVEVGGAVVKVDLHHPLN